MTSEQRTSFGTGGARAYLTHTYPFLPGSVLRGALAAAWLRNHEQTNSFRQIFEFGRFGPALPSWVDVEPQSVSRCKYHDEGGGHDEYVDEAFNADEPGSCAARESLKGNYIRKNLVTHVATALEPRKNTASEGQLFAREMIEKNTQFIGHVVLPMGVDPDRLIKMERAFFGGRGSILGRCRIRIEEVDNPPGIPLPPERHDRVVVRTLSPTILVDDAGLPSIDFAGAIARIVGSKPDQVWAGRVGSGLAGGWHAASGMPKPTEIALAPGAVAVLCGVTPEKVHELVDVGLGVRRNEGYGWVEVVEKPWKPPRESPAGPEPVISVKERVDSAAEELHNIRRLNLTDAQTQWLANQLRRISVGDKNSVEKAMKEPVAGQFTPRQRDCITGLLPTIPKRIRQSVASELTKGARQ